MGKKIERQAQKAKRSKQTKTQESRMRSIIWCPQVIGLACRDWCNDAHIHICIRSVGAELVEPECDSPALFLEFHDLGGDAAPEFQLGLFNDEQARKVVEFVKDSSAKTMIVVNCEAGISRSAGVAAALRKHFNGDDMEVFNRAHPNMFVYRKLMNLLCCEEGNHPQREVEDFCD